MPTYAYLCRACARPFEIRMSIREKDKWKPRCPACGSAKVDQQLFGFSFDGSGRATRPRRVMPPRPRRSLRVSRPLGSGADSHVYEGGTSTYA